MKRILLALAILTAGTSVFCALRHSTWLFRAESATGHGAWLAQTQRLAQTRCQRAELITRVDELRRTLWRHPGPVSVNALAAMIATNGPLHLSPEAREKLLAELGFDWNSSGDYLVVSKDSLHRVSLTPIRDNRLTDTVCGVLALTREERGIIDSTMDRVAADYKTWAVSHVVRAEPDGDVLAKYTLPSSDPGFFESLSNTFGAGVMSTLGAQRGELLLEYARSWMVDLGMDAFEVPRAPTIMTITRTGAGGDVGMGFRLQQAGSTMSTVVSPWQPFPEAFRPVFPGGWPDLAKREGFALPKEFANQSTPR